MAERSRASATTWCVLCGTHEAGTAGGHAPGPWNHIPLPQNYTVLTGLAPEYVEFREAGMAAGEGARHNLLRPEALEAMFVLWRVTQKPRYREWAWAMFQAFERHCKARGPPPRRVRGWPVRYHAEVQAVEQGCSGTHACAGDSC